MYRRPLRIRFVIVELISTMMSLGVLIVIGLEEIECTVIGLLIM